MSAVVLIRCSGCFKRFPINPNKHKDRDTRFCPFCRTAMKVKGRFGKFLPNPKWSEQKAEAADNRRFLKEMRMPKDKNQKQPMFIPPSIPEGILALPMLIKRRQTELEEQAKKGAKPNP